LRQRKTEEGTRELQRARQINPRHPDAAYNLGIVLLGQGKAEEAAALFRETRALGPNRPDVNFYVVYAELEQGHFEEASREAAEGAKIFGKDFQWRSGVGRLFLEHGQARIALPHLDGAFRLQPDSAEARRLLAAARIQLRDPTGALAALPTPLTAEDHYLRASALYLERRFHEADQESRLALKAEPQEPKYLLLEARIAQRAGEHQDALNLLTQAVAAAPEWSEPYYSQGVSYYLQRRYEDARRSLARAIELNPRSSRALFVYAATLVNQGKNREGEEYLHRALALEPSNARFHYHLGALLLRDNRPAEAQKAFEEAVRLNYDFAPPHYQLGKLLVRSNHPGAAAQELETAVHLQPDLAQAYYQLSRAYALLKENDKASRALASFNQLKKQQTDEDQEFLEGIRKEVEAH
jgi:tetratricopeptide (TPR) repeat protein